MERDPLDEMGGFLEWQKRGENQRPLLEKIDPSDVEQIIQVGIGDWSEGRVLVSMFPDAYYVGIDPVPLYICHAEQHEFPGLLICKAAWDVDGQEILMGSQAMGTSAFNKRSMRGEKSILTESITLDSLEVSFSSVFLWMDCEGAERHVLRGASNLMPKIKWILTEHRDESPHEGWCVTSDLFKDLGDLGFVHVGEIEEEYGQSYYKDSLFRSSS